MDPQDGPWTRCSNIMSSSAASLLQLGARRDLESSKDENSDADGDDDDSDDDDEDICTCKNPCRDEGWGMWCYVQSANCRVKEQCEMGGAANKCVADDPAGPWTRCSNLLPPKQNVQQSAAQSANAQLPQ